MKEPLVSIILPTYNGAASIKQAILSVFNQTFSDWELIVIDDCSSQDIEGILFDAFAGRSQNLVTIRNTKNLGIQKSLSLGLAKARGEYVARIDDDDEWIDKEKLEKQISFLERNGDFVLVGTGAVVLDENRKELLRYLLPQEDQTIREKMLSKNCFVHSSVVFNKNDAIMCGGYDISENSKYVEDYHLWLKLGIEGKFYNLPTYSVVLVDRANSLTSSNRITQAKSAIFEVIAFRTQYPNFIRGFFISFARLLFFLIQKLFPLRQFWAVRLKSFYKRS